MSRSTLIAIIGPIITIVTLGGTMLYTQGGMVEKIDNTEIKVEDNRKKIMTNRNKSQTLEVGQERIETKIDMMLKMMEDM